MTGEMSRDEVTRENWPLHFAIADELGGTVEPFDQYQGPYVLADAAKLFIASADGESAYVWNERTNRQSELFYMWDSYAEVEAKTAARAVID